MFDINTFRSSGARHDEGYLKPDKFVVVLTIPPGLNGGSDTTFIRNATRYIQFKIDAVTWPNAVLRPHALRRYGYGPLELRPFDVLFNPVKMTVLCGGLGEEWTFFRRWLNLIYNFHHGYNVASETNDDPLYVSGQFSHDAYEVSFKKDYAATVEIRVYREDEAEILRVVLREAYPLSLDTTLFDWADVRKIQEFTVNFGFIDFYQEILPAQLALGATTTNPEIRAAAGQTPTPTPFAL